MANLDDYNFVKENYAIIRMLWACIYVALTIITIMLTVSLWQAFLTNPTVTTLETAYHPVNQVPYPGISICSMNRISKKRARILAEKITQSGDKDLENITKSLVLLGRLYDFFHKQSEFDQMEYLDSVLKELDMDIIDIMKELTVPCEELFIDCSWKRAKVNCSDIFLLRRSFEGFCCTFNYFKKTGFFRDLEKEPMKGEAGLSMGLSVIINNDIDDYLYAPLETVGTMIQVFAPTDYPDKYSGGLDQIIAEPDTENFMEIIPTTIRTVQEVENYPLAQRQCLFDDERSTQFVDIYSQSDCNVDCRIASIMALCECIPFMIPLSTKDTVCTLMNLACLHRYADKWRIIQPSVDAEYGVLQREQQDSLHCHKICYPSCDGTSYKVSVDVSPILNKKISASNYTVVHLYYNTRFSNLYKQDVVYYWFEILSDFGGTFGLSIGLSLISLIECIMFLFQQVKKRW